MTRTLVGSSQLIQDLDFSLVHRNNNHLSQPLEAKPVVVSSSMSDYSPHHHISLPRYNNSSPRKGTTIVPLEKVQQ